MIFLWEVAVPNKIQEVAVIDDNHLCVILGFVMRIYELNEQGVNLIAQTKVIKLYDYYK